jgi:hypothetical protein
LVIWWIIRGFKHAEKDTQRWWIIYGDTV